MRALPAELQTSVAQTPAVEWLASERRVHYPDAVAFMEARATVKHIQVRTPGLPLFDNVEVGTAKMNMWINPLIVQAGIGTDF